MEPGRPARNHLSAEPEVRCPHTPNGLSTHPEQNMAGVSRHAQRPIGLLSMAGGSGVRAGMALGALISAGSDGPGSACI